MGFPIDLEKLMSHSAQFLLSAATVYRQVATKQGRLVSNTSIGSEGLLRDTIDVEACVEDIASQVCCLKSGRLVQGAAYT